MTTKREDQDQDNQTIDVTEGQGSEPVPQAQDISVLADPDLLELQEAERLAKAEAAGEGEDGEGDDGDHDGEGNAAAGQEAQAEPGTGGQAEPKAEAEGGTPADAPEGKDGQQPQSVMIPKARFDEVYRQNQENHEQVLYLKGALEALKGQVSQTAAGGGQQNQPAPQPTIADQIKAEQAKVLQAAKDFDDGKISLTDYKQIELAVEGNVTGLRERGYRQTMEQEFARRQPKQQPSEQQVSFADQQLLERQANQLLEQHPYLRHMSNNGFEKHTNALVAMAYQEAELMGQPYGSGPAETHRLRAHVARLSDRIGPDWFPDLQPSQQPQPASNPNPAPLSQRAQQRVEKMALAGQMPPNTNQMGSGGQATGLPSEADLMNMTEEEIAALPRETQERILAGG